MDWWEYVPAVAAASLLSTGLATVGRWWMERRKKTKKLLTEDAFKSFFDESILPDLATTIDRMIEDRSGRHALRSSTCTKVRPVVRPTLIAEPVSRWNSRT